MSREIRYLAGCTTTRRSVSAVLLATERPGLANQRTRSLKARLNDSVRITSNIDLDYRTRRSVALSPVHAVWAVRQ